MNLIIITAIFVFVYMNTLYLIARTIKNNSIVDIGWGIGFILICIFSLLNNGLVLSNMTIRNIIPNIFIILWGSRLAVHIFKRNFKKEEDYRYKKMRIDFGKHVNIKSYLYIFMLQGLIMFIISFPVIVNNISPNNNLYITDIIGIILWITGYYFEVVGDYQLKEFIKNKNNKDKIMKYGLWKYTRHPNYFGESYYVVWNIFPYITV